MRVADMKRNTIRFAKYISSRGTNRGRGVSRASSRYKEVEMDKKAKVREVQEQQMDDEDKKEMNEEEVCSNMPRTGALC